MEKVITVGRRHLPLSHIALIEPFELDPNSDFRPERPFKARVVLLNRETILTEETPQEFAQTHDFRLVAEDSVGINPSIEFRVESFDPTEGFNPTKPYQTRLIWRDADGKDQSKLLLTKPDVAVTLVLRSGSEAGDARKQRPTRARRLRAPRLQVVATPES
jgi:hypothetical protein